MHHLRMDERGAKARIVISMVIFGTIGLVRRMIPYSSAMIAFFRGLIATLVLLGIHKAKGRRFDWPKLRANMVLLVVSGAMIGFNWILLFESYRFTTVSIATVCYYMAPIFTILVSPFTLKERITARKAICAVIAMLGLVMVSGVIGGSEKGSDNLKGVLLGLAAAALYATVVNINKKIKDVGGMDRTIFQMGPAAIAVLPYWLLTDNLTSMEFIPSAAAMLLVAGLVNTAIAYDLYFGSIEHLSAQTAALMSYIDPVVAILLSALVLNEAMDTVTIIGVVLIIGAAVVSEIHMSRKRLD